MSQNLYQISAEQNQSWHDHGYVVLRDFFNDIEKQQLVHWTQEIENWPETPGKWMKYYERNKNNQRQLCRIENFLGYHEDWNALLDGQRIIELVSHFMGEPAVLFKEKVNFKLPGGSGFAPHQDAPAFAMFNQDFHITLMIAINKSTKENGCLHVVENQQHKQGIFPQTDNGGIAESVYQHFNWLPIESEIGDIILFDSYIPHYSKANLSDDARRAIYVTYNKLSQGNKRTHYYADKREKFPPECERDPNKDYSKFSSIYNLANPID